MIATQHKAKWSTLVRAWIEPADIFVSEKAQLSWRKIRPYIGVSALLYFVMQFLFGSIPLLSLLQNISHVWNWRIEFVGLPRILLDEYQRLRAAALRHLLEFVHLAIPIPNWLADIFTTWIADILIIYMLFTLSVVRGSAINRRYDRLSIEQDREAFEKQLRSAARLHHLNESNLITRVEGGLKPGFLPWLYFQWRAWRSGLRWPVILKRNVSQLWYDQGVDHAIRLLSIIAATFACAVGGAVFYVLLSYANRP